MSYPAAHKNIGLSDLGGSALKFLRAAQQHRQVGNVIAVFSRCCYVSLPQGSVCIGEPAIGPGPINALITSALHWQHLQKCVEPGMACQVVDDCLQLANFCCSYSDARVQAHRIIETTQGCAAPLSLARITRLAQLAPAESLAAILLQTNGVNAGATALQRSFRDYARPLLRQFSQQLPGMLQTDQGRGVTSRLTVAPQFIGAGPGLTPAGDDLIAGVLLALHYLGYQSQAEQLSGQIDSLLQDNTHPVSATLLRQAAQGRAASTVQHLFDSLASSAPATDQKAGRLLDKLGHTSGWDMLAGIALIAQANGECRAADPSQATTQKTLLQRQA